MQAPRVKRNSQRILTVQHPKIPLLIEEAIDLVSVFGRLKHPEISGHPAVRDNLVPDLLCDAAFFGGIVKGNVCGIASGRSCLKCNPQRFGISQRYLGVRAPHKGQRAGNAGC